MLLQRIVRGYLIRKKHQPRYKGIMKIRQIKANVTRMEEVANQLKSEKESMLKCVYGIQQLIDGSIVKIKENPNITSSQIDGLYNEISKKMDSEMNMLKQKLLQQRNAEEQERLRKIQMALEAEKRIKEEEERKIREEEDMRRQ